KWLCLSVLAYPITVIIIEAPIIDIIKATFLPQVAFNYQTFFLITGLFGTTISPYMFFWQASQEAEEDHRKKLVTMTGKTRTTQKDITRVRIDTIIGMILSQIVT